MCKRKHMIRVTTFIKRSPNEESPDAPDSWRVQSCMIDFGVEAEPRVLLSEVVYASPVAAHQDMQTRAFAEIRRYGYTGPFEGVIWRLHLI